MCADFFSAKAQRLLTTSYRWGVERRFMNAGSATQESTTPLQGSALGTTKVSLFQSSSVGANCRAPSRIALSPIIAALVTRSMNPISSIVDRPPIPVSAN